MLTRDKEESRKACGMDVVVMVVVTTVTKENM
jgi:hypothetical protein